MMMVETELRRSAIHGLGVFLTEPVSAGTIIWQFDSRIDRVYSRDEVASLPAITRDFLKTYSTWHAAAQVWVLCGDNGRHFNHSAPRIPHPTVSPSAWTLPVGIFRRGPN